MQLDDELEGNFNDSIIIDPIKFRNHTQAPSLLHHNNSPSIINFGSYNHYNLSNYLQDHYNGSIIQMLAVDQSSSIIELKPEFMELLQIYSTTQVIFVGVLGPRSSGKSFFLDKMLNLSGVKGNNYHNKQRTGLYLWSIPYIKQDLRIFFVEMVCDEVNSKKFQKLSAIMMLICSPILYFNEIQTKSSIHEFQESLDKSLNSIYYQRKLVIQTDLIAGTLFNINRNMIESGGPSNKLFKRIINESLENAKNKDYKGHDSDLCAVPFMSKDCINQAYIKKVSAIFLDVYSYCKERKLKGLNQNGNILSKIIKHLVIGLNSNKPIEIQKLIDQIMKELYISAYNYCLIGYHEDLESEFQDEQPKDIDNILDIFQKTSQKAIQTFSEYSLDHKMHQEFQNKLQQHIQDKEKLVMQINDKKKIVKLIDDLNNINFNNPSTMKKQFNKLKNLSFSSKDQMLLLADKLKQVTQVIYNHSNIDYQQMKAIQTLTVLKEKKINQLKTLIQNNQNKRKQLLQQNKQYQSLKVKEQAMNKKILHQKSELQRLKSHEQPDQKKYQQMLKGLKNQVETNQAIIQKYSNPKDEQTSKIIDKKREQIEKIKQTIKQRQQELKSIQQTNKVKQDKNASKMKPSDEKANKKPQNVKKVQEKPADSTIKKKQEPVKRISKNQSPKK